MRRYISSASSASISRLDAVALMRAPPSSHRTSTRARRRAPRSRVSPMPMPFAAVSSSFVTAVVGSGTSSSRPSSRARFRSFCIMWQSNHTSSGWPSTSGPRYATIGEAITLASITSTARSRGMPALLGEQHAFAEREHLHREREVDRDLHRHRGAARAEVEHLRPDRLEHRPDALERVLVAADHDREPSPARW